MMQESYLTKQSASVIVCTKIQPGIGRPASVDRENGWPGGVNGQSSGCRFGLDHCGGHPVGPITLMVVAGADPKIPVGEPILLISGSVTGIRRVFADPDIFDMDRYTGASLVFGGGRHHCLGSSPGQLGFASLPTRVTPRRLTPAREPAG